MYFLVLIFIKYFYELFRVRSNILLDVDFFLLVYVLILSEDIFFMKDVDLKV